MPNILPDTSYTAAWNESVQRVIARDNIIMGYSAVCASLLVISVDSTGIATLAFAIPILTLVAGALVAHHDYLISMLNIYLKQFKNSEFETWHRRHLAHATAIGLIFHTIPAIIVSVIFTWISIVVASSATTPVSFRSLLLVLRDIDYVAGWLGVALFGVGRAFQIYAGRKKVD